jgi:outer membrane lipoprotein SlyB
VLGLTTRTFRRVPRPGSRFRRELNSEELDSMMRTSRVLPVTAGLLMVACATVPTGPSVMVLPGSGKNFEQFQTDDAVCRQWAAQQTGTTTKKVAHESTVSGAVIGTAVGAVAGAAIGAAAGSPGTGAAVGAGVGLLGGTAAGAGAAEGSQATVQRRYDITYMQCMYAKGNQIPVPKGSLPASYTAPPGPPPPATSAPASVPPPPAGAPPPPPPGTSR